MTPSQEILIEEVLMPAQTRRFATKLNGSLGPEGNANRPTVTLFEVEEVRRQRWDSRNDGTRPEICVVSRQPGNGGGTR